MGRRTTTTTSTTRIMRRAIFTFLQNYQCFTSTSSLLAFPFAVSTLLSQMLVYSSDVFPVIHARLRSLFLAAGFPLSSELFSLLNLKLSQTILSFLFVSPFTYSFLLLAKASVIKTFDQNKPEENPRVSSSISLFIPLLITQLCNSLLILAANATCFFILVIFFNFLYVLGISSPGPTMLVSALGVVIYSIVLANAYIVSNLALVSTGMEKRGGFISILKACVMILLQGRNATALSLAVPVSMSLAAIEALFQYRIVGAYNNGGDAIAMIIEGVLVAYLYALVLVLDTVVGCVFWKICTKDQRIIDEEEMHSYKIEIEDRDGKFLAKSMSLDEIIP
ncbi:hypothetical protein ABFS82_04G153900 [Erythranthe guttata]|uniref:uncharacterized protein LOC105973283 n=1 Tax=Erythranthe guttata TaxID=4155 RepID=UPI00064DA629|nr:PREDICTED: uncharacterized protein LOC105973283 [Erythranthe guttata]|eukprot:XP_012853758.1 PREDICTED: uncharacterized protein LOC105973283 [Erythranthe guttata]